MKKSDLTGYEIWFKQETCDIPIALLKCIAGRIAGVKVVNASQDPGASSTVRILVIILLLVSTLLLL